MSHTVGFLFHVALYPVFEVGYTCIHCVEVRITLPLVISEAHQSHECPQLFAVPLYLRVAKERIVVVAGLVLRESNKDPPCVRGTYVRWFIVRLLAGAEHIVCDTDWNTITSILLLTGDYISKMNKPNPRLLIRA